jgi:hypothetical protein
VGVFASGCREGAEFLIARWVRFESAAQVRDLLCYPLTPVEERLDHLDVAGHSDLRVTLQRFVE